MKEPNFLLKTERRKCKNKPKNIARLMSSTFLGVLQGKENHAENQQMFGGKSTRK